MLKLLEKLIACPSITPEDAGCQAILTQELKKINFHCESLPFGPVKNLWARLGSEKPLFVFAGHTDVVPPGPLKEWVHPPFAFTLQKDLVFGRGTADMKGAIAAMVVACREFLEKQKKHKIQTISWLYASKTHTVYQLFPPFALSQQTVA